MIDHSDLLLTLTQIAMALLGFTGVVIALKHETKVWAPLEEIGFQALITTTLTALIASLLPSIFSIVVEEEQAIWRLSNLGIGILHFANLLAIIIKTSKSKIIQQSDRKASIKDIVDLILGPVLIVSHFIAARGWIPWADLLLVIGIIQQLYIGMGNFLRLVKSAPNTAK